MGQKKLMKNELRPMSTQLSVSQKLQQPTLEEAERPSEKTLKEYENFIVVNNTWNEQSDKLRVERIVFRKGENLADLNCLHTTESKELLRIQYGNSEYILRKASLDVAKAVMNIYSKIKNHVEGIVGYLVTTLGSLYLITKANPQYFSFDAELSSTVSRYQNPRFLDEESKLDMLGRAIEQLIELNKKNLVLNKMTIKNILYSGKNVLLTDLRSLRMTLCPKATIDCLKSFLKQLLQMGLITKDEVTYLLTYYLGGHPELCMNWYKIKHSKKGEELEVLNALEQEIIPAQSA